jgi:hypothetical protein
MRFHRVGERYESSSLKATVVEIMAQGWVAVFELESGERQSVNYAHVLAGHWRKIP